MITKERGEKDLAETVSISSLVHNEYVLMKKITATIIPSKEGIAFKQGLAARDIIVKEVRTKDVSHIARKIRANLDRTHSKEDQTSSLCEETDLLQSGEKSMASAKQDKIRDRFQTKQNKALKKTEDILAALEIVRQLPPLTEDEEEALNAQSKQSLKDRWASK